MTLSMIKGVGIALLEGRSVGTIGQQATSKKYTPSRQAWRPILGNQISPFWWGDRGYNRSPFCPPILGIAAVGRENFAPSNGVIGGGDHVFAR